MKQLKYMAAALLMAGSLHAQDEIEVKSKIESVTVFLRGAQVTRTANVPLHKGKNVVYFRGLGEGINPQSIQAAAPQAYLINSVIHEVNYLDKQIESPKVKMLQDSLEIIQKLVESNTLEFNVLETEKAMINKNQSIASKEQGMSVDELQKMTEFYRSRYTEILDKQLTYSRSNNKLALRRNAINLQLNELNARRNRPSNDIRVIVQSEGDATAPIGLSYVVNEAGWVPSYNIRAKDTQSPITLEYRADVYQNSGVDWEDVQLTLSSGNPNTGGTQPTLNPWNLYVEEPIVYTIQRERYNAGAYKKAEAAPVADKSEESDWGGASDEESPASEPEMTIDYESTATLADYTTVREGATTAEFRISLPQTIRSNGKAEQVTVRNANLPTFYRHFAVPKLDNDAFLTAGLTGWDTLNLLPGKAQVFFEGTYVTEVDIDPAYTNDTLNLSLGRDKKIVIERNQLKDFNKVRTIGVNRERTFAYEIKVRNTKEGAVNLTLEDQIPVSQDKDIVVSLVDASGAKLDEATGKLTWVLDVAKAETKVVKLMFTVKYPKNRSIPGI
ncbi:MAG: DUF4139 domain-containing protein [Bacteroidia bacterium]